MENQQTKIQASPCMPCDCQTIFGGPCPCLDQELMQEHSECKTCCDEWEELKKECEDIDCNDCDGGTDCGKVDSFDSPMCPCRCCPQQCKKSTFCNPDPCLNQFGASCLCSDPTEANTGFCKDCCSKKCDHIDCDDCDAWGADDEVGNCGYADCPCECCSQCTNNNTPCSNNTSVQSTLQDTDECCQPFTASTLSDPHVTTFFGEKYTL